MNHRRAIAAPISFAVVALATGLLLWHASRYLPFIADDSLISLRYAERLLEGKGLTWTDGEAVEGYSNLLWVLGCALFGLFGVDLILASRILGVLCTAAAIFALVRSVRPASLREAPAALLPALALAAAGPMAVWAIGGLEQPMLAALLAWAVVLSMPLVERGGEDRVLGPGLCLAGICLTRPDGPIFTVAIFATILLARRFERSAWRTAIRLAAIPFAAWLGQLLFRLAYYGDWVANTARAKVAFTSQRLEAGLHYVGAGFWWLGGLTLLGLLGLLVFLPVDGGREGARSRRPQVMLLLLTLFLWTAYVAAIGGDIFPARRHLVPSVVLLALLGAEGLRWAFERRPAWMVGATAFGAAALAILVPMQMRDRENDRAIRERWEWDGEVIGNLLRQAFWDRQPLVATDPAGCIPYFSKLPSLDLLGLNDRWLALHPPPDFGTGYSGHELGNGEYVLSREPDLLVFCGPRGADRPCFRSGRELMGIPEFRRRYVPITFEGSTPYRVSSRIWVRKEDGRIGIERREGEVVVPGYLFASPKETVARIDGEGRLGASLRRGSTLLLELPKGSWEARIESSGAPALLAVRRGRSQLGEGEGSVSFTTAGGPHALHLRPVEEGKEVHVRRIAFARVETPPEPAEPILPTDVGAP